MNNSIIIKDWASVRVEQPAAEAITPGQFMSRDANGEFIANATAGAAGPLIVALEDENQGNTIEDDYASGDRVDAWVPRSGAQVLAKVLSGFSPAVGDRVQLSASGNLEALDAGTPGTSFPGNAVAQVIDATHQVDDNSNHRIIVEII